MGNDKVLHNDRLWNERLQKKVMEEYEREQERRERELEHAEEQRLHKLRMEGYLEEEEEKAKKERRQRIFEAALTARRERDNSIRYETPSEDELETQMEILHREDEEAKKEEEEKEKEEERNQEDDAPLTFRGDLGRWRDEMTVYNPNLAKLYEEEDLASLYSEAEKLVFISPSKKPVKA